MDSTKRFFSRWADWGAISVALLAALALSITVIVARSDLRGTSEAMARGEGQALLARVHEGFRGSGSRGPPSQALVESELARLRPSGLRYLAIESPERRVAAGEPSIDATELPDGLLVFRGSRALLVGVLPPPAHHPGPPAGAFDPMLPPPWADLGGPPDPGGQGPLVGPPIVIEFEPLFLARLETGMNRTVAVGALAVLVLVAFASVLTVRLTRRARLAQQAERERRLVALGEMSSVMAHELRNPLASLKGNAQLLAEMLTPGTREHTKSELVVAEAERLERLTQDLLAFVREGALVRGEVSPADLVERALRDLPPGRVAVDLSGAPPRLLVDEARLAVAVGNVVRNALQASAEVELRVRVSGRCVHIEVTDRGPGIPPGDEERIFEPFHTTRRHGTGLGLAVARRAVEQHGGTLRGETRPGGGAIFRMIVPHGTTPGEA